MQTAAAMVVTLAANMAVVVAVWRLPLAAATHSRMPVVTMGGDL